MRNVGKPLFGLAVALAVVALLADPASAWRLRASIERSCTASGVQLIVHFSNVEANASQVMTVSATDLQTSKFMSLGNVVPGHSVQGTIDTALPTVKAGKVRLDLSWAGNPKAHDQQLVSYGAFGCDPPPAVPDGINGATLGAIVTGVVGIGVWRRQRMGAAAGARS